MPRARKLPRDRARGRGSATPRSRAGGRVRDDLVRMADRLERSIEKHRAAAEQLREEAERLRESAEIGRRQSEGQRAHAEASRIDSEDARQLREESRIEMEDVRRVSEHERAAQGRTSAPGLVGPELRQAIREEVELALRALHSSEAGTSEAGPGSPPLKNGRRGQ